MTARRLVAFGLACGWLGVLAGRLLDALVFTREGKT